MPTINQLTKKPRVKPKHRDKVPALERSPQKKVYVSRYIQQHPKNLIQH